LLIGIYLSFFDKKELTNGIDWFIPCAMNANENSPKADSRLSRIKIVSRIARLIVFCFFVFTICFLLKVVFGLFRERDSNILTHEFLLIILQGVLCVWYWKLAQLFRLYENGLIFAAETIRCIKFLGLLCAVDWDSGGLFAGLTLIFVAWLLKEAQELQEEQELTV
jgi:hypothetical protein